MRPITLTVCFWSIAMAAQDPPPISFDFPDFASSQHLNLVGTARTAGTSIRITEARTMSSGGFWYVAKEPVGRGFETTFRFQLTEQGGLGRGADGLAFVIQNSGSAALAGKGSAGGWGFGDGDRNRRRLGIPRAIAIFFDTFKNNEDHDPSDNYVEICTNGGPRQMKWPPRRLAYMPRLAVELKDGRVHTARIRYRPPLISVFLDDDTKPVLISPVDLTLVTDRVGGAWVGFTASTGSGYENHDLLSWSFNTTDVSSAMVTSNISFQMERCLPGHNLCTPDHAAVNETEPGHYHVVLPGNLEWGASIPNPSRKEVAVEDAHGFVCWDLQARGNEGCGGPEHALVQKTEKGRTYFSVKDREFKDNEGYFEFDVIVK